MKLEPHRLILRDWRKSDTDDIIEGLNDLEVSRWLAFVPYPYTRDHAVAWLNFCAESRKQRPRRAYHFAIELRSEARVIGGVGLDQIDHHHGTAGGGIWLNAKYHGRGCGSEAFAARIAFAFERLNLRRLESGYLRGNTASRKMLERLGFKKEGLKQQRFLSMADGKLKDEYTMALLKENWLKERVAIPRPRVR